MKTFGQALRERRKQKGWTLEDVATRLDCTKQYLSEIENDRFNPTIKLAKKLSKVFGSKFIAHIYARSPGYLSKKLLSASPLKLACVKLILDEPSSSVQRICKRIMFERARQD